MTTHDSLSLSLSPPPSQVGSHVDLASALGVTESFESETNKTSYSYAYSLVNGIEGDARLIYQPVIVLSCSLAVAGLNLVGTWNPSDYEKDGDESGLEVLNGTLVFPTYLQRKKGTHSE